MLVACGVQPPKQAEGCPQGTVLKDGSCVPPEDGTSSTGHPDTSPASTGTSTGTASTADTSSTSSGSSPPYDKEATEGALKRAARSVKQHCGGALDENGKASGPWGPAKISVKLGHNGRVKEVNVPAPFDGKATGKCTVNAFTGLVFPPFPGGDVTVDWDVEIVQPKK